MTRHPGRPPLGGAVWTTVRLVLDVAPVQAAGLVALVLAKVALTALLTLLVGRLLGAVTGEAGAAVPTAVTVGAVLVLDAVLDPVRELLASRCGRAVNAALASRVLAGSLAPTGVGHLDDPDVAACVQAAREATSGMFRVEQAVPSLVRLLAYRLAGGTAWLVLLTVEPWAAVVLGAAWLVVGRRQDRRLTRGAGLVTGGTESLGRARYLRDLALSPAAAMEVRVFGLQRWLVTGFARAWRDGTSALRSRGAELRAALTETAVLGGAHLVVLSALAVDATSGRLGVAGLGVAVQAVVGMVALGTGGDSQALVRAACANVPAALRAAALDPAAGTVGPGRPGGADATGLPAQGIRFDGVRFGYRDGRGVLDGLDLWIPAGTSLALVGSNGVGKSTVVKLLAGLYEPDAGRVTVDGHDLRSLDPDSWRRRLAVVFQDFVRYQGTVAENVAFGRPGARREPGALDRAAERAGLADVVRTLPSGWRTRLGHDGGDGTDLSGGQWQRLALARALFAVEQGARVLVLDEPAAHLDAHAERRLYADFLDLTRGLTTVLVSHRFATVRLADLIVVLDGGRVVEQGTHDELVARDGRYAAMFTAQTGVAGERGVTSRA